jgi:uroporphyrinogen decarboxylase
MRQAGRHLPGYRALRERWSFLDLCSREEVNRIASAEPFHAYGVDGVIVFNDILIPLGDMGMGLDFIPAPKFDRLIQSPADAAALRTPVYDDSTAVSRCLRALREEVGERAAVLGFIGAPFTVAGFAIGGVGAQWPSMTELVFARSEVFQAMQERLTPVLASYAEIQVRAGADVIQIFESLADKLGPDEYRRVGLPHLLGVVRAIRERVPATPLIIFGRGLWPFVVDLAACGATLSMDHAFALSDARATLRSQGLHNALQGNLSPETLLLPPAQAVETAAELLANWACIVPFPERAGLLGPTGWVFNLGHGVPADADPKTVGAVVERVRSFKPAADRECKETLQ